MNDEEPPFEAVSTMLTYREETGKLIWKHRPVEHFKSLQGWKMWNTRYALKEAGGYDIKGYVRVSIDGKSYKAHRLAWLLKYGTWPDCDLDHINGDPQDNRIINLRQVSHAENMQNKKLHSNNNSGQPGVSFIKQYTKWRACIGLNGKVQHLGWFDSLEDAVTARKQAEIARQFHPNHGRTV